VAQPGEGAVGAATTAPSPYPLPKEREKKEIFSTEQDTIALLRQNLQDELPKREIFDTLWEAKVPVERW
jgi:hypothetical protein